MLDLDRSFSIDELREEISSLEDSEDPDNLELLKEILQEMEDNRLEELISSDYFYEYAENLIKDCSSISYKEWNNFPYRYIDLEAAAKELQNDYTIINVGDKDYYGR